MEFIMSRQDANRKTANVLFADYVKKELSGGHLLMADLVNYYHTRHPRIHPFVWCNNHKHFLENHLSQQVPRHIFEIPASLTRLNRKSHWWAFLAAGPALLRFSTSFTVAFCKFLKNKNIQTVHVHSLMALSFVAVATKLTKRKLVYHLHDALLTTEQCGDMSRLAIRLNLFWMKYFCSQVIVISGFVQNTVADQVCSRLICSKTTHIPNGVRTDKFGPSDGSGLQTQGYHGRRVRLFSLGVLSKKKGFHLAIRAVAILRERFSLPAQYDIAGEGEYKTELTAMIQKLKLSAAVRLLGFIKDPVPNFQQADFVLVPSVWEEPFGLVVAEAMACGKVVIATQNGAIPELIEDGRSGFLVSASNAPEEIASLVSRLSNEPERMKQVGRNAAQRVFKYFSFERMAERVAECYQQADEH